MINEQTPIGDSDDEDDYDVNLEEPVIEPGKPDTLDDLARDSQQGVAPGLTEDGPKGIPGLGPEGLTFESRSNP